MDSCNNAIQIHIETNNDLRPTQNITALYANGHSLCSQEYQWGIKPDWAKRPIINAQAETVTSKKTFKKAFQTARCIVPCMGWYEWRDKGQPRKQKYAFSHTLSRPFLMAAVGFHSEFGPQIVTLTTKATATCEHIHHRMPLLLHHDMAMDWLETDNQDKLDHLLMHGHQDEIRYAQVN